uniref:hypothetical protein n=1 Tax=Microbulbifer agarilyticus TaxID=260552 RepID=UPI000255B667|nr:hypothetical protein [Microbulbifer agarilyticus]
MAIKHLIGKVSLAFLIAVVVAYMGLLFVVRATFPQWFFLGLELVGLVAVIWLIKQLVSGRLSGTEQQS